ncbi:hypothetical protein FOZ63_023386 [Perkinsus olseni]|uniref:Uncharacterized protein n=1 Tax=Perkinsus olseni TaxID=32597 RepID=A0A7J6SJB4_PEROL|nr:hypothetical protein FOZ63_023386 [Perkinsus olseni]KAF4737315.1 hypothetical protein FOZ62_007727 [Perkinsus olseni]
MSADCPPGQPAYMCNLDTVHFDYTKKINEIAVQAEVELQSMGSSSKQVLERRKMGYLAMNALVPLLAATHRGIAGLKKQDYHVMKSYLKKYDVNEATRTKVWEKMRHRTQTNVAIHNPFLENESEMCSTKRKTSPTKEKKRPSKKKTITTKRETSPSKKMRPSKKNMSSSDSQMSSSESD